MRLILHVGTYKTGTTAIQRFFFDNQTALKPEGIHYVKTGLKTDDAWGPRHRWLAHLAHRSPEIWSRFHAELKNASPQIAIVSYEGFWRFLGHVPQLASELSPYEVTVVAGLRRQDRFLASFHLQCIRYNRDDAPPARKWNNRPYMKNQMRYHTAMQVWCENFGRDSVRPFLYDEARKDVLPQFMEAAGLPPTLLKNTPPHNVSPEKWTPEGVLGEKLAKAVLARYADENKRLFADFFPGQSWPEPAAPGGTCL